MSVLNWFTQAIFTGTVEKDGRRLVVSISEHSGYLAVVALVTKDRLDDIEQVFDQHSHKVVAKCDSPPEAFQLAEEFAKKWIEEGDTEPPCECEEIP